MHQVLLLGAGNIGSAVAKFLTASGDFDVLVGDVNADALRRVANAAAVKTIQIDSSNPSELRDAMKDRQSVVSALNFSFNIGIAETALEHGLSYFDLTEDVATTKAISGISRRAKAGQVFMPQC